MPIDKYRMAQDSLKALMSPYNTVISTNKEELLCNAVLAVKSILKTNQDDIGSVISSIEERMSRLDPYSDLYSVYQQCLKIIKDVYAI